MKMIPFLAQRITRRQKDIARVLREKKSGPLKPFKKKDGKAPGKSGGRRIP